MKRTFRRRLVGGLGLMALTSACADNGTGPDVHMVLVSPSNVVLEAGDTVRLTATLQENGRTVETSSIAWTSSDLGVAAVSSSGLVTGGVTVGAVTITATVNARSGRASVTVVAGPPSVLTIPTQPSPFAASGEAFSEQPVVLVQDDWGNPVSGGDVTASIETGGGAMGGTATVTTDGSGLATFADLSITGSVGARTLRFSAGAVHVISGSIEIGAGAVASLVITQQPSSTVTNDEVFATQPVARAQDGANNLVAGANVTVEIASGGGTLGGTTTVSTDGSGLATFTDLKITGTVGGRTLRFSTDGTDVVSNTVEVEAGAPAAVTIVTPPPSATLDGVAFNQQPVVEMEDVSGNPVSGENVTVTIDGGGGSLGGTTTVSTDGSGRATFSNLSIDGSPGERTLRFAAGSLDDVSNPVHVAYSQGTYTDVQYCGSIAAQRMDVSVPSNVFNRPLPVAAFVHGGSWTGGSKTMGPFMGQIRSELLSRGYVVVSLDYRLATETTNKWPAQIHDVKCAMRNLRAEADDYGIDDRIGVWGDSAGGHLASMLGVTDGSEGLEGSGGYPEVSSRVEAVATLGGISDLTQDPDHPEIQFSGPEKTFSDWPGPSPELTDASPITWASSDDPPFLIVHGSVDTKVLPGQAQRLFDELDTAGANVTLQFVTNGDHNFDDSGGIAAPSKAELTIQIADFLDTHVRLRP